MRFQQKQAHCCSYFPRIILRKGKTQRYLLKFRFDFLIVDKALRPGDMLPKSEV
jgi:hypothetical protein